MDIFEISIHVMNHGEEARIWAAKGEKERAEKELREIQQLLEKEIGSIAAKDDHPADETKIPKEPATEK